MSQLDELVAFNDELLALTRAGCPVGLGLSEVDPDAQEAIGRINALMTRDLSRGVSLSDALAGADSKLPAAYRQTVQAGLRCGRLPTAFECRQDNAGIILAVRQQLALTLIYPLMLCTLAFLLFIGLCLYLEPQFEAFQASMELDSTSGLNVLHAFRAALPIWAAVPPVLTLSWVASSWYAKRQGRRSPIGDWLWSLIPGVRRIEQDETHAVSAKLIALLVEHDVPLNEAVPLALDAAGEERALRSSTRPVPGKDTSSRDLVERLPPLLRWALTHDAQREERVSVLRMAAETYSLRAAQRFERLRTMFPLVTCVVLAGGATLLYALSVFLPLVQLLYQMN